MQEIGSVAFANCRRDCPGRRDCRGVGRALIFRRAAGRSAIVDRLGEAAGETSFGNSGIVQCEAVVPYVFPRNISEIARAALNRDPRAHIRYAALPSIAPALWRYFQASTPARKNETARAMAPFVGAASAEHRKLAQQAGVGALLRETGWIKAFRGARGEELVHEEIEELKPYGVRPALLDRAALVALEPHVGEAALGGAHFTEPLTTPDPQRLTRSYAALFLARGGRLEKGDARSLCAIGRGMDGCDRSRTLGGQARGGRARAVVG